ncbi:MAG: FGGY family carbohydrate kinase [Clostridia bacterium]|nr:FGGY family carbohydrate kinase [Clostridia bacterium]
MSFLGLIGIDLGTTNTKVGLYDEQLRRRALLSRPMRYQRDGAAVEFDAEEVLRDLVEMLRELGGQGASISHVGLTGQAESLVLAGEDGRPVRPAISWMDERSVAECMEIEGKTTKDELYAVTGQKAVIPTWPAAKLLRLNKTEPDALVKARWFVMLKDYIAWRLCGVLVADKSIATFSLYFDIHKGQYWDKMLNICGIEKRKLPTLAEPCQTLGPLDPKGEFALGEAYDGAQLNIGTLDHFAAMLGTGNISAGGLSESTGTVMAMAAMAQKPIAGRDGAALHYGPWPGSYVFLPVAESGGICLEWFRDRFLPGACFADIDAAVAAKGYDSALRLIFLPYLAGVNAPEFDGEACGVFFGLRAETDVYDMARAVMEGVALLLWRNIFDIENTGVKVRRVLSSGGGAGSDLWLQMKADICELEVCVTKDTEAACLGAAMAAAVGAGLFSCFQEAADACVIIEKSFKPSSDPSVTAYYERKKRGFHALYSAMRSVNSAMTAT